MKKIIWNIIFWIVILLFPYICCQTARLFNKDIVIGTGGYSLSNHLMGKDIMLEIHGLYKSIDVEEYVVGVVSGVISPDYNMEALKTQAVLVRTNVLKEMEEKNTKDDADISYNYITKEERQLMWGRVKYDNYESRIEQAVAATSGKVIRKENSLIMALYHEVSIGKTVSASELLGEDISYLQSVDSSQDVEAKNYMNIYSYSWDELKDVLYAKDVKVSSVENGNVEGETASDDDMDNINKESVNTEQCEISIEKSTENGFVEELSIDGKIYTGQEGADMFELPSTNYYIENTDSGVRFVCLGKGNCMGVSQYGANLMADKGKSMEEIITYYYGNVSIEPAFGS